MTWGGHLISTSLTVSCFPSLKAPIAPPLFLLPSLISTHQPTNLYLSPYLKLSFLSSPWQPLSGKTMLRSASKAGPIYNEGGTCYSLWGQLTLSCIHSPHYFFFPWPFTAHLSHISPFPTSYTPTNCLFIYILSFSTMGTQCSLHHSTVFDFVFTRMYGGCS